jgi:ATP-dependent Clp protease ATP-binding subunit ClpA
MFERFTAKARRTIVDAQEEARHLRHNYIGTEHILLGLLHEGQGVGPRVLAQFEMTLEGAREAVTEIVGEGKQPAPGGHIPFTPRAKKVLELSLREALTLHHNYIGTEHILLGLIREADGVAAQVIKRHADLLQVRTAVLDLVEEGDPAAHTTRPRSWLRRVVARPLGEGERPGQAEEALLNATPAADATLTTAAQLAGGEAVGSHHLLLAALTDINSAAARVLTSLGVDLNRAKEALHRADVAGTSDEQPEDAGRRQMNLTVTDETLTIVVVDETLVKSANAALRALGGAPGDTIRGADLSGAPASNLGKAWTALHNALSAIATRAEAEAKAAQAEAKAAQAEAEAKARAEATAQAEGRTQAEATPPAEEAGDAESGPPEASAS